MKPAQTGVDPVWRFTYSTARMLPTWRFPALSMALLLAVCAGRTNAQLPAAPPNSARVQRPGGLVVLRNGEVLRGQVVPAGERVLVTLPGREISLRPSEIDVVASSLEEAYALKRSRIPPTDVAGRLDLAAWCLRHNLKADAGGELAAVAQVQPFNPRLAVLQQRVQKALAAASDAAARAGNESFERETNENSPVQRAQFLASRDAAHAGDQQARYSWPPVSGAGSAPSASAAKGPSTPTVSARRETASSSAADDSPAALERLVRSLPSPAVEAFTNSLQPMITHGCATAGCHAPGNKTDFTLLRLPQGRMVSRRLTQRNLYNTVQLVDFANPEESQLLKIASRPHGPLKSGVFGDHRSPKYKELVAWVSGLTGAKTKQDDAASEQGVPTIDWERLAGEHGDASLAVGDQDGSVNQRTGAPTNQLDRSSGAPSLAGSDSAVDKLRPNQPAEIKSRGARAHAKRAGYGRSSTISPAQSARRK